MVGVGGAETQAVVEAARGEIGVDDLQVGASGACRAAELHQRDSQRTPETRAAKFGAYDDVEQADGAAVEHGEAEACRRAADAGGREGGRQRDGLHDAVVNEPLRRRDALRGGDRR